MMTAKRVETSRTNPTGNVEVGNIPSNGASKGLVVSYTHCTNEALGEAPSNLRRIRRERRNSMIPIMMSERVKM